MIFKIIKDAFRETLTEYSGTPVWLKENIINISMFAVGIALLFGWLVLSLVFAQTMLGTGLFSFIVFLVVGGISNLLLISFYAKFCEKIADKYKKYLTDKEEIFKRLSE